MRLSPAPAMAARRPRRGATLIELMITMVLLSIVMAGVLGVLRKQQIFFGAATRTMDIRQQLSEGAATLPADLRSLSSVGGDIGSPLRIDSLKIRTTFGSSIACAISGFASAGAVSGTISLPPEGQLAKGNILTSFLVPPQVNDTIYIMSEGATAAKNDDTWSTHRITAISSTSALTNCPTSTGFTSSTDLGNAYTLTVSPGLPDNVQTGAPIRFAHTVGYALMQRNGRYYLGYCGTGACSSTNPPQPIVGPLYGSSTLPTFQYFDSTGAQLSAGSTDTAKVARILVTLRARTGAISLTSSGNRAARTDSLQFNVAIRNRS